MGIINHDGYILPWTGQTITDTYFRVGENQIQVKKMIPREFEENQEITFELSCGFELFASKQACLDKRPAIGGDYISIRVDYKTIDTTPVYTLAYSQLKLKYPNFTDDLIIP
jgi:hypothetical protein